MNYPIIEGQKSEIPISESGIFLIKKKTKNAKKKKRLKESFFLVPQGHTSQQPYYHRDINIAKTSGKTQTVCSQFQRSICERRVKFVEDLPALNSLAPVGSLGAGFFLTHQGMWDEGGLWLRKGRGLSSRKGLPPSLAQPQK